MLQATLAQWGGTSDFWIFGYASLIWRPNFDFCEQRPAHVHGWHRALKMWSNVNRGTPQCPGLVFALLSGGSCHGVVLREDIQARDCRSSAARFKSSTVSTSVTQPTSVTMISVAPRARTTEAAP